MDRNSAMNTQVLSANSIAKGFQASAVQCLNTLWSTQACSWQAYLMDAVIPQNFLVIFPFSSPIKTTKGVSFSPEKKNPKQYSLPHESPCCLQGHFLVILLTKGQSASNVKERLVSTMLTTHCCLNKPLESWLLMQAPKYCIVTSKFNCSVLFCSYGNQQSEHLQASKRHTYSKLVIPWVYKISTSIPQ